MLILIVTALRAQENGAELMDLNLGDSSVSLQASGSWQTSLNLGGGIAFTPFGNEALAGDEPLFRQEIDLTLSLWLLDRWFVETTFLDDYSLNTYRAGYRGAAGEIVQYAGIGNTGLDFPAFPYLDLGEASPSSFGFYGRFGSGDFAVHSLVRHDMAAREEKVFQGGRERSYSYTAVTSPLRGVSFVLPDTNLSEVPLIFIEDKNGSFTDADGRKWRQLESSEYAASAASGIVELNLGAYTGGLTEPQGMIAAAYSVNGNQKPWAASLGNYGVSGAAGAGFLGGTQDYFDNSGKVYDLADYPQSGSDFLPASGTAGNGPGETFINNAPALVIYEQGTFSPFERQNQYLVPSNDAAGLVRLSTGIVVSGYELPPDETGADGLVRLIRAPRANENDSAGRRHEKDRWPLAVVFPQAVDIEPWPELYLPGAQIFTGDIGIRTTSYGPVDSFNIGTDIVPGSVQVFRDGLLDPAFSYNPASGTVSLASAPFFNELIRISYLRRSMERRTGSVAAGVGAVWNNGEHFSSKVGFGLRWNLSDSGFSEQAVSGPGTAGIGASAAWNYDNLKAGLTLGLGFEQPDTSGLYRAAGMEGSEFIIGLSADSFISAPAKAFNLAARAPLVYRNYRGTNFLGGSSLGTITSSAEIVAGQSGPYPAMDSAFTTNGSVQILAAEFELDSEKNWTGFEIPLEENGSVLERAKEIEIPFRFYTIQGEADKLKVIFQAGRLAEKDSIIPENPALVIEKIIYQNQPPSSDPEASPLNEKSRYFRINLTDEDRRKLDGANHFRIIITAALDAGEAIKGRLILATPVVKGAGFRPVIVNDNGIIPAADTNAPFTDNVAVMEALDRGTSRLADKYGAEVNRLHPDGKSNRILETAWAGLGVGSGAGADQRINAAPLNNYRSLSFFVRRPKAENGGEQIDSGHFHFMLGHGPESYNNSDKILDTVFPLDAFQRAGIAEGEWAKVQIRYQGQNRGIYIDNYEVDITDFPDTTLLYRPDLAAGNSSLWLAFLVTPDSLSSLPDGGMALDELVLEEAIAAYRFNAGGNVTWNLPGTVFAIGGVPVLSDLTLSAAVESGAGGNPFEETVNSGGMNGRTRVDFSLLGAKVTGNYSYSFQSRSHDAAANYAWRGGHSISRAWGGFSVAESFDFAPGDSALQHKISAALDAPFRLSLSGDFVLRGGRHDRKWQGSVGANIAGLPLDLSLTVNSGWTENAAAPADNYAAAWVESFSPLLPDFGNNALKRESAANISADLGTTPLGFRLIAEGTSLFLDSGKITVSGASARMDFPWNLVVDSKAYRFLFREERAYRRNLVYDGADFRDDLGRFGEALGDSVPLMFGIPFYSFFDPNAQNTLKIANAGLYADSFLNSGRFTETFEFSLLMPDNYTVSALFIPSQISLRINRVLDQKMDIFQDTLSYGGALNFSAVNLFGAMGARPVFLFYAADQFSHSLDASITMPRNEKTGFRIQSGQEMLFHGFSGAELSLKHLLTASSSGFANNEIRWTDTARAEWLCPVEKSLLGTVYAAIMGAAEQQSSWLTLAELGRADYELLIRESLDFTFEYIPGTVSAASNFTLELKHESIVRVLGRLNLSVYAKLNIGEDFSTRILKALAGAGITLKITF